MRNAPLPHRLADIGRVGIDHDDPAIGRQPVQHGVGHITRMPIQRARRTMAEHHRRMGHSQGIQHGLFGHMRQIDQHPHPLHLAHHIATERGQPIMRGRVRGAIGPCGILEMGQRHIARAQRIHLPEHAERPIDRMPALHADQAGDTPCPPRRTHTGTVRTILEPVRVSRDEALRHVDLLQRRLHRLWPRQISRDIDRPELRPHMPLGEAGKVGLHGLMRAIGRVRGIGKIKARQHILAAIAQLLGHIIVAIPYRRLGQRSLGHRLGRWTGGGKAGLANHHQPRCGDKALAQGYVSHEGASVVSGANRPSG